MQPLRWALCKYRQVRPEWRTDIYWGDYPPDWIDKTGPRNLVHCWANDTDDPTAMPRWGKVGKQKIEDEGPLAPFPNMAGRQRWQEGRKAKYDMGPARELREDSPAFRLSLLKSERLRIKIVLAAIGAAFAIRTTSFQNKPVSLVAFAVFLVLLPCRPAIAQTFQFLPEVDVYNRLQSDIRFNFQAKETREAGDPTQIEIGPGFDFFLKPLVRLKDLTAFDLDDAKARPLQFSVGFRYVPSPAKPHVERLELAVTPRWPLFAGILLTDRNRADLDWSKDQLTWRYRNRVTLERRLTTSSYHPAPYLSAEIFYQSQYQKWTTTALYAGCLLPVGKHFEFDPYYEHQNVTNKRPNQQFNQFGLVLNMYF